MFIVILQGRELLVRASGFDNSKDCGIIVDVELHIKSTVETVVAQVQSDAVEIIALCVHKNYSWPTSDLQDASTSSSSR